MKKSLSVLGQSFALILTVGLGNYAHAAFVGPFDLANWRFAKGLNSDDSSVDTSLAPSSFTLYGSDSGSGRSSFSTFYLDAQLGDFYSSGSVSYQITFLRPGGPGGSDKPLAVTTYSAAVPTVTLNFDWSYSTLDPDGPDFDSLECNPSCSGGGHSGGGHSSYTWNALGFRFEDAVNPFDGDTYSVWVPFIDTTATLPRIFASILTNDNMEGRAQVTWSNFNAEQSLQNSSGEITTVPLPPSFMLFISALGSIATLIRKAAL